MLTVPRGRLSQTFLWEGHSLVEGGKKGNLLLNEWSPTSCSYGNITYSSHDRELIICWLLQGRFFCSLPPALSLRWLPMGWSWIFDKVLQTSWKLRWVCIHSLHTLHPPPHLVAQADIVRSNTLIKCVLAWVLINGLLLPESYYSL